MSGRVVGLLTRGPLKWTIKGSFEWNSSIGTLECKKYKYKYIKNNKNNQLEGIKSKWACGQALKKENKKNIILKIIKNNSIILIFKIYHFFIILYETPAHCPPT